MNSIRCKNELNDINKKIRFAEESAEDPLVKEDRKKKTELEHKRDTFIEKIGALKQDIENNDNLSVTRQKNINRITESLDLAKENLEIGGEV